jgi:hypothetical protein
MLAVVSIALLTVVSCDRASEPQATGTSTPVAATPAATPCSISDGSLEQQKGGDASDVAHVTDVRYKADGCPRIVFEFRDQEAGYTVEYASPPFSECGSGEAISTSTWDATAYLVVRLEPARSADLDRENAPPTYDGPRDFSVRGDVLKHLKVICDFEAVFTWLVALDKRHELSVVTMDDPSRIVIDISET